MILAGLQRKLAIAASSRCPSSRSPAMNEIITTPFSTATRESAMKPTAAEIDNGIPGLP